MCSTRIPNHQLQENRPRPGSNGVLGPQLPGRAGGARGDPNRGGRPVTGPPPGRRLRQTKKNGVGFKMWRGCFKIRFFNEISHLFFDVFSGAFFKKQKTNPPSIQPGVFQPLSRTYGELCKRHPGPGGECVGRVAAVGSAVEHVAVGDAVVALPERCE